MAKSTDKAKKAPAEKKAGTELVAIQDRARKRDLAAQDLEILRDEIADLRDAGEIEDRITRTALRNLKVADTQLRDLLERARDGRIDDAAFAGLPDHLKKQILTRLGNNVARMRRALAAAGKDDYTSPAFKCVEDYERCKARATGSPIWCHLAMIVCQVRALGGILKSVSGTKS
ncbi:MAG: hypothetical protein RLZ98_1826 [Pseudomonadota bacterium]|jgi:hypothetical protein